MSSTVLHGEGIIYSIYQLQRKQFTQVKSLSSCKTSHSSTLINSIQHGQSLVLHCIMARRMDIGSHLRSILQFTEISSFSIFLSILCNKTIYQKINQFVYSMPISPLYMHKCNVISDWIERLFQFPIYFLIQTSVYKAH